MHIIAEEIRGFQRLRSRAGSLVYYILETCNFFKVIQTIRYRNIYFNIIMSILTSNKVKNYH